MERLSLGWDLGLRLLAGFGGASRGAGGFSGARNPEPPRNFGSDCISSGRAGGRDPREATTDKLLHSVALRTMQPLLCALAGLALLRAEAAEWVQGPRDTPGRRGRNERGDRNTGKSGGSERRWWKNQRHRRTEKRGDEGER